MTSRGAIDLHSHTNLSDGTDTPAQLMRAGADAGLATLALTDHDTFDGLPEAMANLPAGLQLVPGVELSCFAQEGDERISLHLLAYLCSPGDEELSSCLSNVRDSRVNRAQRMVAALAADGWPITWEQVSTLAGTGSTVGRPHVAQALVDSGVLPDVGSAFVPEWLATAGRYFRDKEEIPVLDALRMVQAAGGVAVFAHPLARRRGPVVSRSTYEAMSGAGLFALEAHHPDHTPDQVAEVEAIAADLGLALTGSSDYHGSRKPNRLGDCSTEPAVLAQILERGSGASAVTG